MANIRIDGERPTLSFEFFPPKTPEGEAALRETIETLSFRKPAFVSVTYGAGGSIIDRTRDVVVDLAATYPFAVMPHLTCVGHRRDEVDELLDDYADHGIDNILALAGDPPADGTEPGGDFRYASELVEQIQAHRHGFSIGVAAFPEVHPRSKSREEDRRHLVRKLDAADFGITQFFFRAEHYLRMIDELTELGCDTPVLPGIIPVINPKSIRRFAAMNAAEVDEALFERLEAADDEDRLAIAVDHALGLATELLEAGVPGLHFYALNRAEAATGVLDALDW